MWFTAIRVVCLSCRVAFFGFCLAVVIMLYQDLPENFQSRAELDFDDGRRRRVAVNPGYISTIILCSYHTMAKILNSINLNSINFRNIIIIVIPNYIIICHISFLNWTYYYILLI